MTECNESRVAGARLSGASRAVLLRMWSEQGVRPPDNGGALQGLSLRGSEDRRHERRSHAWTGYIAFDGIHISIATFKSSVALGRKYISEVYMHLKLSVYIRKVY